MTQKTDIGSLGAHHRTQLLLLAVTAAVVVVLGLLVYLPVRHLAPAFASDRPSLILAYPAGFVAFLGGLANMLGNVIAALIANQPWRRGFVRGVIAGCLWAAVVGTVAACA